MNKSRYHEEDFPSFVEQLIETCRVEGKQAGIAKLFLDKGYEALSFRQKYVFDKAISQNTIDSCERCGISIPWCEMLEALDNGGYCNYCQHMMEKEEEEDKMFLSNAISASTISIANEATIKDSTLPKRDPNDSSIGLSMMLLGENVERKVTQDEIRTAYLSSIKDQQNGSEL